MKKRTFLFSVFLFCFWAIEAYPLSVNNVNTVLFGYNTYFLSFNIDGVAPYTVDGVATDSIYTKNYDCNTPYNVIVADATGASVAISGLSPCGNGAVIDFAFTIANQPIVIGVLYNDADVSLGVISVSDPLHGIAIINPDKTITYIPDDDFGGIDTFSYQIIDGYGETANAIVVVKVWGNYNLYAESSHDCSNAAATGQYLVNVYFESGTPPYNITGSYNQSNFTENFLSFNVVNGSGYWLKITDAQGNEKIIDELDIPTCSSSCQYLFASYSYECLNNNTANTWAAISGGTPPYSVWGNGVYDIDTGSLLNFTTNNEGTFLFQVHEGELWTVFLQDANGCIFSQTGMFKVPHLSINTIAPLSTNSPSFTIYENNIFGMTFDFLDGQFFFDAPGGIDNGDGFSAQITPFLAGSGLFDVYYCVEPESDGTGVGFGSGYYANSCQICTQQSLAIYPSFEGYDGAGELLIDIGVNTEGSPQADEVLPQNFYLSDGAVSLGLTKFDAIADLFNSLSSDFDPNNEIDEIDQYITWQGEGITDNLDGTATFDPSIAGTGMHFIFAFVGYPLFPTNRFVIINVQPDTNNLTATYIRDCSNVVVSSDEYTVTVNIEGGTPPYTVAGTYNNTTSDSLSFNVPNGSGFQLVITDTNGNQYSIDEADIEPCYTPLTVYDFYTQVFEDVYAINATIIGGTAPYTTNYGTITFGDYLTASFNCGTPYNITITDADGTTANIAGSIDCNFTANPDQATTTPDQAITIDVLANDTGDGLSIMATTNPAHGTATINPNGTITYTPDGDFIGSDLFVYQITNSDGQIVTTYVTIILASPNLQVNWNRNCYNTQISGQYTVTVFIQGGTAPYSVAGTYNQTNITGGSFLFSSYNSLGFYLVISDANGQQFIIDVSDIIPCMGCSECPVWYDCPALELNIGNACNDNNPDTQNDVVQFGCVCAGEAVGINSADSNSTIRIYPNPSTGIINLESGNNTPATIRVYDAIGQLIIEQTTHFEQKETLDLSNKGSGIYLIGIQTNNSYTLTKVVVQ